MTRNTILADPNELFSEAFPYALWPLMPTVYSIQPLPDQAGRKALELWISDLSRALKRRCALVLGPSECLYYDTDGQAQWSAHPPTGGIAYQASVAIPDLPANYLDQPRTNSEIIRRAS